MIGSWLLQTVVHSTFRIWIDIWLHLASFVGTFAQYQLSTMTDANNIFSSLDAPFRNFEKAVEPIVWQSSDILVMQTYDLKVPTLAGSTVKYSFSTKLGDISFTTEFHAAGQVSSNSAAASKTVWSPKFWYLHSTATPSSCSAHACA